MPGDGHAGCGERPGETGQEQSRHRAPGRLNQSFRLLIASRLLLSSAAGQRAYILFNWDDATKQGGAHSGGHIDFRK